MQTYIVYNVADVTTTLFTFGLQYSSPWVATEMVLLVNSPSLSRGRSMIHAPLLAGMMATAGVLQLTTMMWTNLLASALKLVRPGLYSLYIYTLYIYIVYKEYIYCTQSVCQQRGATLFLNVEVSYPDNMVGTISSCIYLSWTQSGLHAACASQFPISGTQTVKICNRRRRQ